MCSRKIYKTILIIILGIIIIISPNLFTGSITDETFSSPHNSVFLISRVIAMISGIYLIVKYGIN